MQKTLIVGSLSVVAILVLAGFTPTLASKPSQQQTALVPIEVTNYLKGTPVTSRTMVSPNDAEHIKVLVAELSDALNAHNVHAAAAAVQALQGYGIAFGPQFLPLMNLKGVLSRHMSSPLGPDANLSNSACILNAHGEGMLAGYFTEKILQAIAKAIANQTNPIAAILVLIIMLPLILTVILFNDLIPLRFMMPHGTLVLANGTISTRGLEGYKHVTVGANHAQVNVSGFTGITLNILPFNNRTKAFCFIFGFAMKTEGYISG